jgi:hypothetical protein
MSQKSRPESDFQTGGWTPTPIYSRINEVEADDGSFVNSPNTPEGGTFIVNLADLAWPSTGIQRATFRLKRNGSDDIGATIALLQGNTLIAAKNVKPGANFADYAITLTDAEISKITDYTALRASVTAGYPIQNACCSASFPVILRGTVTNQTGQCTCIPSAIFLQWQEDSWKWRHGGDCFVGCVGPSDNPVVLRCNLNGMTCNDIILSCPRFVQSYAPQQGCSCSPLNLVYNCQTFDPNLQEVDGSFTITITE